VELIFASENEIPANISDQKDYFRVDRKQAILRLEKLGTIVVSNGNRVKIIPDDGIDFDHLRRYVIGNIFGILLYQRGFAVLHASSLKIKNQTIAILGDIGKGKSSLAASLVMRGSDFLSDDVTAVDFSSKPFHVIPAYPYIKIHPTIATSIGIPKHDLLPICAGEEKKWFPVIDRYLSSPQPLSRVYILSSDPLIRIEPANSQESIIECIRYTIPTRWSFPSDKIHFDNILQLVGKMQFYKIYRPNVQQSLPKVVQMLEEHLDKI
jgi:hypothetical protein